MTDQQNHAHLDGSSITITRARANSERGRLFIAIHDAGTTASTYLATDRLLTMIDIIDPAAMRAYFRETVSEADSPEDIDERRLSDPLTTGDLADLREAGRTLGEAWREFRDAVRAGADR